MATKGKGKTAKPVQGDTALEGVLTNLPKEVQDDVQMVRGIARSLGSALTLTIVAGMLEPGHSAENKAIDAMLEGWTILADKVMLFVLDKETR